MSTHQASEEASSDPTWRMAAFGGPGRRWRDRFRVMRDRLAASVREDLEFGCAAYWVPVCLAVGSLAYVASPVEPPAGLCLSACAGLWTFWFICRARDVAPLLVPVCALMLTGVCLAQINLRLTGTVVIPAPLTAEVTGWVEDVTARPPERIRMRVRVSEWTSRRSLERTPGRIVVSSRTGDPVQLGASVSFKARLFPPQGPIIHGGYDFALGSYLKGVGATGFVYGSAEVLPKTRAPPDLRVKAWIAKLRHALASRIRATLPSAHSGIAVALITGDRSGIPEEAQEALRASGLAHVLAISGLHMMLVAGSMFAMVRFGLAAIPIIALRWPIKKVAASAALAVAIGYLILSGASVATQRAFVMTAVALFAVLLDRQAISMHSVAVAATLLLVVSPLSVVNPGFQMSFLAVIALVATYRGFVDRPSTRAASANTTGATLLSRMRVASGRYVSGLLLSSLVAGLATAPVAAYTFHRVAYLGLAANLLAMPVMGTLVMPVALLLVLAVPVGLDAWVAPFLSAGLGWLLAVAQRIEDLGGSGFIGSQSIWMPVCCAAGQLVLCLLRGPARYLGVPLLVAGLAFGLASEQVDARIAEGGQVASFHERGSLVLVGTRASDFLLSYWQRANGSNPASADPVRQTPCDRLSCTYLWFIGGGSPEPESEANRLKERRRVPGERRVGGPDGRIPTSRWSMTIDRPDLLVEVVKSPKGLTRACRRADIVITRFRLRYPCRSALLVFDGTLLSRTGAVEIKVERLTEAVARITFRAAVRSISRPWTRWRTLSSPSRTTP